MKMNVTYMLVIGVILGVIIAGIDVEPFYLDFIVSLVILIPIYYILSYRYEVIRKCLKQ